MLSAPFEHITDEKKRRILEAALSEFSKNGYDAAATRAITKEAGVSDGLLFYYFGDKRELYFTLCDTLTDFLVEKYFYDEGVNNKEALKKMEFFERIYLIVSKKIELILKYPDIYKVVINSYIKFPEYLKRGRERVIEEYDWIYRTDLCFKDGVDEELAGEIIETAFNGLSDKFMNMAADVTDMESFVNYAFAKTREYLDFFKKHLGK